MISIDRKYISKKIKNNEPISITFKYIDEELLMIFNTILVKLLSKMDHIYLLNSLITILREIIVNALKANAKRVYFKKNNLDINNHDNYIEGMKNFRDTIIGNFDLMKSDLNDSEYYINIIFETKEDDLILKIQNNSEIIEEELDRINARIEQAINCNDFSEIYENINDTSEGAGLGIVLIILFLKNMGIDPWLYKINSSNGNTETILTIPKQIKAAEIITKVKNQIIKEIDGIPTFPENILHLQKLCNNPKSSINEIAKKIMVDPALTADVIKLSNSAGIAPGKRIENVNTAIITIGLKNLNAILIASNARRILNEKYNKFEQIWEHCNKTAFYARNIALTYHNVHIVDNAFMAGLLHDLGKIVLLSTDLNLVKKIAKITKDRKIASSTIMEEISIGISHSTIGDMIAKNWNFPQYLIEAIKFHHSPFNADQKYKDIVNTVYLANMLCGIEDRRYIYSYIDESILERYELNNPADLIEFHEILQTKYDTSLIFR